MLIAEDHASGPADEGLENKMEILKNQTLYRCSYYKNKKLEYLPHGEATASTMVIILKWVLNEED